MPPLLADFIYNRVCELKCEKFLTPPLISLILLFLLVKDENDVNIYAAITVFSGVGSNALNYVHARKYCKIGLTREIDWKKHIKPIMVLFSMAITVTIYVSSDTTILGFLCSDYEVGIYSVSAKIYNVIKTLVSSIIVVSIPRMSANQLEYNASYRDI